MFAKKNVSFSVPFMAWNGPDLSKILKQELWNCIKICLACQNFISMKPTKKGINKFFVYLLRFASPVFFASLLSCIYHVADLMCSLFLEVKKDVKDPLWLDYNARSHDNLRQWRWNKIDGERQVFVCPVRFAANRTIIYETFVEANIVCLKAFFSYRSFLVSCVKFFSEIRRFKTWSFMFLKHFLQMCINYEWEDVVTHYFDLTNKTLAELQGETINVTLIKKLSFVKLTLRWRRIWRIVMQLIKCTLLIR